MPHKHQILIVEDDEIIANLITTMLERKGYHVIGSLASGEEAIAKAAETDPDLVIMDIMLAGLMDGVAAARYIFQLFSIPIIFLTAMCDDTLLERAKGSQPYGYIIKPFTDKELTSNIRLAIYNHAIRKQYLERGPLGDPKKFMAALEAVIITDTRGRIILSNQYAARLTECSEKEMLMNKCNNVISLINSQTSEPIKDPIPEVVRQMVVVIHEFNTEIVTKSGKHRKVAVTVRPIKDEQNDLIGVFLHLKEKTLNQIRMDKITRPGFPESE